MRFDRNPRTGLLVFKLSVGKLAIGLHGIHTEQYFPSLLTFGDVGVTLVNQGLSHRHHLAHRYRNRPGDDHHHCCRELGRCRHARPACWRGGPNPRQEAAQETAGGGW